MTGVAVVPAASAEDTVRTLRKEDIVEVVRTLVGSIGLILAVPLTTLIASLVVSAEKKK